MSVELPDLSAPVSETESECYCETICECEISE